MAGNKKNKRKGGKMWRKMAQRNLDRQREENREAVHQNFQRIFGGLL